MPALTPIFWLFPGGTWKSDFVYPIPNWQLSWPGYDTSYHYPKIIQHFKPFFTITIFSIWMSIRVRSPSSSDEIVYTSIFAILQHYLYMYERKVPWIMKMTFFVKTNFIKIFKNKVLPRKKPIEIDILISEENMIHFVTMARLLFKIQKR